MDSGKKLKVTKENPAMNPANPANPADTHSPPKPPKLTELFLELDHHLLHFELLVIKGRLRVSIRVTGLITRSRFCL
jgi:hypothetical protein